MATRPPPPVGYVRITASDPPLEITARLSDERPDVSSGSGGWDSVERPRRRPLTSWKGAPQRTLTLPLLVDGFLLDDQTDAGKQIEDAISVVQRMGQPSASDGEPPQLKLHVQGGHVPYSGLTWVVGDIAWGDALMNLDGNRVRQAFTLTLLEYVQDIYLAERSAANRRRRKKRPKKHGASAKRVVAKRSAKPKRKAPHALLLAGALAAGGEDFGTGEDLLSIAARELGDAARWVEIAELNGLRDPRAISPGQVLRLP